MRVRILFLLYAFFITACGDDNNGGDIRNSDDPLFQQMSAAFDNKPLGLNNGEHNHFHPTGTEKELQRVAFNLYETLVSPELKVVSLGCGDVDFCMRVLNLSLKLVIDSGTQGEKILMFPSYLKPPYEMAEKAGVSIVLYDVPSFDKVSNN